MRNQKDSPRPASSKSAQVVIKNVQFCAGDLQQQTRGETWPRAPPGMSETAQRGGHIPGAVSVPWSTAVSPDGTFKRPEDLRTIYINQKGVDPDKDTIACCRIGEPSSHTWFVLKYLLGFKNVKNCDGSWTEYGNLVAAPIEKA